MEPERHDLRLKRIQKHGECLIKLYPNTTYKDPISLYKTLRELEIKAQSACEKLANGVEQAEEEEEALELQLEDILKKVYTILAIENEHSQIFLDRDLRSPIIQITTKDMFNRNFHIHRDMGEGGIIAPAL